VLPCNRTRSAAPCDAALGAKASIGARQLVRLVGLVVVWMRTRDNVSAVVIANLCAFVRQQHSTAQHRESEWSSPDYDCARDDDMPRDPLDAKAASTGA
jgi:hypothetical protein